MIPEKRDDECVSLRINKICEAHKRMIINKQNQVREQQGRRVGKGVAIKMLLDDLIELKMKG